MKKRKLWSLTPPTVVLGAALLLSVGVTFFLSPVVFSAELGLTVSIFSVVAWRLLHVKRDIRLTLSKVADTLDQTEKAALADSPLPVVVSSEQGEILWYNERFRNEVLENVDVYGDQLITVTGGLSLSELEEKKAVDISFESRRYTAYISHVSEQDNGFYVFYYVENTQLKQISEEYRLSRPSVVLFYIDNMDELLQNARDSERAQISGKVETLLEDWTSATTGLLRRYATDRFMLIVEQRHLHYMVLKKFDILDKVHSIHSGASLNATLSIGVGQGATLRESEQLARQAIEMALGRGGDQAAVKTKNGYDFYGGLSKGVERRTKVRTRVVATAMLGLIRNSENVVVMGHRYSDLDCLGSAAAFASCVRCLGKPANVVVRKAQTLASELIERYKAAGKGDLFLEPEDARPDITSETLLVITDTHNPRMLESDEIYRAARAVVVIDHHRKMVDHIDNAVIFYHEPHASSASEMVSELVQYLDGVALTRLDAESLMAGIMLDTRNFVLKAGVRTFEAAAYLRKLGADTVEVKRLFSENMATYKEKSDIVAQAQFYKQTAIAIDRTSGGSKLRIAASQAADELLYIKGVEASFVLFTEGSTVNISARSLGEFNVQLVMEALGGGGHLTMAGTQLENTATEQVYELLKQEIDHYREEHNTPAVTQPIS